MYFHTVSLNENKANVIQVLHMCQALANLDYEVHLFVPTEKSEQAPSEIARKKLGVSHINFSIKTYSRKVIFGQFRSLSCIPACLSESQKGNYEVIYLRNMMIFISFLKFKGKRIIYESHYHYTQNLFVKLVLLCLERLTVKMAKTIQCRAFITISGNLKKYWVQKGIPENRISVAHGGVDLELIPKKNNQVVLRKQLKLPIERKIAVYAGSLIADRNIMQILDLAREFHDVLFIVIGGDENERLALKAKARKRRLSNVIFKEYLLQSMVFQYLSAADILLMLWSRAVPTINYCSPMKLFEYMASGRIIVGHRFPPIEEIIQSGVHAYLVSPDSFDELKTTFSQALGDTIPNKMTKNAQELAKRFTWGKRVCSIMDFFLKNNFHSSVNIKE